MTAARSSRSRSTASRRKRDSEGTRDAILRVVDETKASRARSEQAPTGPKVATRDDVKQLAHELTEAFLHCRDYGHQWRMANARREGKLRIRTMFCPSCKYNKYQTFDSRGILVEQKHDYPEGYLIKGLGRIVGDTKGLIRLESIDRLIEKQEAKRKG
jgi:hypothetical protein